MNKINGKVRQSTIARIRTSSSGNGLANRASDVVTKPGLVGIQWFADGHETTVPERAGIRQTLDWLDGHDERLGVAVIHQPNRTQIDHVITEMRLTPLLAEDLKEGHQRPKLERHGDALFMVLHPPFYIDSSEDVAFVEAEVVKQNNFVLIITQRIPDELATLSWSPRIPSNAHMLSKGSESVLYTVLDGVVDQTNPVIDGLQKDIEQIEYQVFTGDPAAPERIYRLSRETMDLQRAINPLIPIVGSLRAGFNKHQVSESLQGYLGDVADHLARIVNQITDIRELLNQVLAVNSTLVDQERNENLKKVSSWAAILVVPTLISGIYGMNFDNMPVLHLRYGYPLSLAMMAVAAFILWLIFRKKDWL